MTLQATYSTTTPAFRLTTTPDSGVALPLTDPSALGNRPLAAFLQATTHDVRWTVDGTTPTSSHGMVLTAGAVPFLYAGDLAGLQFIQSTSGSVLNVVYAGIADTVGPQGPPGIQGATGAPGSVYPITIPVLSALGVVRTVEKIINYTDFTGPGSAAPATAPLYTLSAGDVLLVATLTTLVLFDDAPVNGFIITTVGNSVSINSLASSDYTVKATSQGLRILGGGATTFGGAVYGPPVTPATADVPLIVRADAWNGDGTMGQAVAHLVIVTPAAE